MLRAILTAGALALTALPVVAAELVHKPSPHSVADTMDRLEAAVTGAGATVFARVDHTAGAESAGMEMPAAQVLIFGNPKLGTPAMQADIAAGLDLPMRLLVAEVGEEVHVIYRAPDALAEDHDLPADAAYLQQMAGALDKLSARAVATD